MNMHELYERAQTAAFASYSPYSRFRVGAALLCSDSTVFIGTNVENRSFGLTICAERSAIVSAVSAGRRDFTALAISTPDSDYPVSPCGACRQVLSEFVPSDFPVLFGGRSGGTVETTAGALMPYDALHELGK
ncbi:MAG: cytidine deaminase [Spirochaetes bacterium]|nr:cytidine deaminase [Spirochaetota bacterium]